MKVKWMEFIENLLMRKETEQENPADGCSAAAPHTSAGDFDSSIP